MKNIVLYKSKYGNTFQYATWIAEELGWELRDLGKFKKEETKNYQNIIFGSGVYMNRLNKKKQVLEWFKDKPIIIFACGGNNNVEKNIDDIKRNNFTEEQLAFHKFFYLPGGLDFSKLKGFYRLFMSVVKKFMEKKKNRTKDEEAILEGFSNPTNFVDRREIEAIVAYAKNLRDL